MLKKLSWFVCFAALAVWAQSGGDASDSWGDESSQNSSDDSWGDDDSWGSDDSWANTDASSQPAEEAASTQTTTVEEDNSDLEVAGDDAMRARAKERDEQRKLEEEQRADEFANSLRRRDWLRNRLILEIGMGSRMPVMGETGIGMGFGAGLEYITPIHLGVFGSFGIIPSGTDDDFDDIDLEGGFAWKAGLTYYLFPKNPLHLGIGVSYGTVYYDHDVEATEDNDMTRSIITVDGFQFDLLVMYMTDSWYYLQFAIGMYYAPDAKDESYHYATVTADKKTSRVVDEDGISKYGIVFGITIGFAFPEFFPDDTEVRRREREKARNK